jgi:hypothetical protein
MQRLGMAMSLAVALCVSAVVFIASDAPIANLPTVLGELAVSTKAYAVSPVPTVRIRRSVPALPIGASLTLNDTALTMGVIEQSMNAMHFARNNTLASIQVP